MVVRQGRLPGDEAPAMAALGAVIDAADVKRDGIVATSLDVALNNFNNSHTSGSPFERLVDLATALEAVLLGGENESEGLTLRLRNRAAALLARDDDPGPDVFEDVNQLYRLRSKLVHGGQITEKALRKVFRGMSTMPVRDTDRLETAIACAVDRMRDLVRRAILARLCLAELPEPLWPFAGHTSIDAILASDTQRQAWRVHWHSRLVELGAGAADRRPREPIELIPVRQPTTTLRSGS